jgi:hypothetical protein
MSHNLWLTSRNPPFSATRAIPTAAFSKTALNRASLSGVDAELPRVSCKVSNPQPVIDLVSGFPRTYESAKGFGFFKDRAVMPSVKPARKLVE